MLTEYCGHIDENLNEGNLFDMECDKCGLSITFADDASILIKAKRGECGTISRKLDDLLEQLKNFLKANSLQLNIDKSQLLRITSRQQLVANGGETCCWRL